MEKNEDRRSETEQKQDANGRHDVNDERHDMMNKRQLHWFASNRLAVCIACVATTQFPCPETTVVRGCLRNGRAASSVKQTTRNNSETRLMSRESLACKFLSLKQKRLLLRISSANEKSTSLKTQGGPSGNRILRSIFGFVS